MNYNRERVKDILPHLKEISNSHHEEVKDFSNLFLKLDEETYYEYEESGSLIAYAARNANNEPVGYASFFIFGNHHYGNQMEAHQDAIYILPDYRGFGSEFVEFIDQDLRNLGIKTVYHHVKVEHDWSKALVRQGYKHIEHIYAKQL